MRVPDPNGFGGVVEVWKPGMSAWEAIPYTHGYAQNTRSLGVADMATAIRSGRPHRANGALANHVLDIMHAVHEAAQSGKYIDLTSQVDRPAPFPIGMEPGVLDA